MILNYVKKKLCSIRKITKKLIHSTKPYSKVIIHTSGVMEVKKQQTIMAKANDRAMDRFWLIVCDTFFSGPAISLKKILFETFNVRVQLTNSSQ